MVQRLVNIGTRLPGRPFYNNAGCAVKCEDSEYAMLDSIQQDIRVGVRRLGRAPGFAVVAILTLALGIGLATAVFSVANSLLIERLPVHDQDRVVVLWGQSRDGQYDNVPLLSHQEARDFSRATRALSRVAFVEREGAWPTPVTVGNQVTRFRRALVSGGFFDVLGTRAILGRAFRAEDDMLGAAPVVVLSYPAWQNLFGGDPKVVGRHFQIQQTGIDFTIVGVMPQGLDYPRGTDFWAAVTPATAAPAYDHPFVELDVIGRLAAGASPSAAREEMSAFFARPDAPKIQHDVHGVVNTLPRLVLGDVRPAILIFAVAVGLLLLITCINVANLLLIRGIGRAGEIAVRSAIGASRRRIVRQLITESALLAMVGGALGALVAVASLRLFVAFAPSDIPRLDEIRVGPMTLLMATSITLLTAFIFGVAPAFAATRGEQGSLRPGIRQSNSPHVRHATEVLVVGQVALALMILSAAGLVGRSLLALEHADLGYDPSRLVVAELTLRHDRFANKDQQVALLDRLVPRVGAIPGVDAVTPVGTPPFGGSGIDFRPDIEGQAPSEAAKNPFVNVEAVSPNYFRTLGVSLSGGRAFTDEDRSGSVPVVVISQSIAKRFWPGENAVGKRLKGVAGGLATIVGIAPDTRYRDLRDSRPSLYLPLQQSPFPFAPTTLLIRAHDGVRTESMVASLRTAIAEVDAGVAVTSVRSFGDVLAQPLAHPRLNAGLLIVFAGAALLLAAIGLFGVMMTMVRQRTRELGVRMALGATSGEIERLVLGRGVRLAAIGIGAGLVAGMLANRLLTEILYQVTPTDLVTLVGAPVLLLVLASLAAFLPARASGRIAPTVALRGDD